MLHAVLASNGPRITISGRFSVRSDPSGFDGRHLDDQPGRIDAAAADVLRGHDLHERDEMPEDVLDELQALAERRVRLGIRLAGMLCIEANDEWLVGRRYLSAESISLVLTGRDDHSPKETKEAMPELQAA
jgi:hypothetical protein